MINISKKELEEFLDYNNLIAALKKAFQEDYQVPVRHHHNYANSKEESTNFSQTNFAFSKFLPQTKTS